MGTDSKSPTTRAQRINGPVAYEGRNAFDQWRRAVSEAFVPLTAVSNDRAARDFRGALHCAPLGSAMQLSEVSGGRVDVLRTPETIRKSDPGFVKVGLQIRGSGVLRQGAHEAHLTPGDFAVYDTRTPYELHFAGDFTMFVVMLPHERLKVSPGRLAAASGRRISAHDGVGTLISPFLVSLRQNLQQCTLPAAPLFEDAVADLLSAACDETVPPILERSGPTLLVRAKAFIDDNLSEPDLSTTLIAAHHHISIRYLQKLFESDGLTVTSWIRSRRLDKCRRELGDPRWSRETIRTICARYGFLDTAHFSRLFKETYGQAPRDYRKAALSCPTTTTDDFGPHSNTKTLPYLAERCVTQTQSWPALAR